MIDLQNDVLGPLLKKAEEFERKYEWLQAAEVYGKAVNFCKDEQSIKATEFLEKMGFGFYKAAMQAPDNGEFIRRMKLAIQTYEKESRLLEKKGKKSSHILALIAYTSSCLEKNPLKKKKLLAKWWNLEKQAKEEFENVSDLHSMARICTNLIEYSSYDWIWGSSSFLETRNIYKECLDFAERAIPILYDLEDEWELARAYCFASWHYGFSYWFWESEKKSFSFLQKAEDYSKKALELAQKIGDAWLISQSYISIWNVNQGISPTSAIDPGKKILKYGEKTKDNWCIGWGHVLTSFSILRHAEQLEDPEKQREGFEKAIEMTKNARKLFRRIHGVHELHICSNAHNMVLTKLAEIETDQKRKITLLEMGNTLIQETEKSLKNREVITNHSSGLLGQNFLQLAKTETEIQKKRELLLRAKTCTEKQLNFSNEMQPFHYLARSINYFKLAMVLRELASIELNITKKIKLLKQATDSIRKSLEQTQKVKEYIQKSAWANGFYSGRYYYNLGKLLQQIHFLTKERKIIDEAIAAYNKTVFHMKKAELPTHVAETYWHLAQLHDLSGRFHESSKNYELTSQTYELVSKKIPQLENFYSDYSVYMLAWSQIEQARYYHSIEAYEEARHNYEQAAKLHKSTSSWSYLAPNYFAWSFMEEAERLSRKENTQQAKQTFKKAFEYFCNAEEVFKRKLEEITSADEKEMTQRLFKASDLRRKYCQARMLMEDAKLLDREGKYLQSSKNYGKAAQNIFEIIDNVDVGAERKELKYIAILCRAWEKMAIAEETTSAKSYVEAAELFEQAKDYCFTRKASLWAIGNSSFCKGLAAGTRYQNSMDLKENALAKSHMKRAATSYQQAGFKNASEYAKATQRMFDAYAFINQGESEVNPENKAKQYQMAENLLQLAAGSFMKAKQPEKTAQVQEILTNVREEKTLAISLSQVMKAPAIVSTTQSFTAPTQTSEVSVGLENFDHANVQANLVTQVKEVKVGESFCLSVEFVNAGREAALLLRVENFISSDFVVVKKPEIYRIEDTCLNMKGKQLAPLRLVEVELTLQASKKGDYRLNPRVLYLDELGQKQSLQLKTLEIRVEEIVLEDRVSTGTQELDSLLLGGIPNEYAVVLAGSPCDEREMVIKNFLKAGTKDEEITFYISKEVVGLEDLLDNRNFILFLCNPKPKAQVPDFLNMYRLQGTTDLTNLGIALAKACRGIGKSVAKRRVCVGILSDVLVEYGTKTAREWMSGPITDLGSKGFTLLAVMDPKEHPTDQATTVLNLFDGEIELTQTEDPLECKKSIRIKKLRNQDYIKNPICLTNK